MAYTGTRCYLVSFEIASPNRLTALQTQLRAYDAVCPINATCWAIVTNQSATQICDHLKQVVDESDRIFVVRSGTEAAWINAYAQGNTDWLQKYL